MKHCQPCSGRNLLATTGSPDLPGWGEKGRGSRGGTPSVLWRSPGQQSRITHGSLLGMPTPEPSPEPPKELVLVHGHQVIPTHAGLRSTEPLQSVCALSDRSSGLCQCCCGFSVPWHPHFHPCAPLLCLISFVLCPWLVLESCGV